MNDNQGPDTPSGLISPPLGCQAEIKEEPVDEDATENKALSIKLSEQETKWKEDQEAATANLKMVVEEKEKIEWCNEKLKSEVSKMMEERESMSRCIEELKENISKI